MSDFNFNDKISQEENINVQDNQNATTVSGEVSSNDTFNSTESTCADSEQDTQQAGVNNSTYSNETESKKDEKASLVDLTGVKKNKAPMLNRGLILAISTVTLLSVFLFVFIKGGSKPKSKKKLDAIAKANNVYVPNFDEMAQNNLDGVACGESVPDLEDDTPFIDNEDEQITIDSIDNKIIENANNIGTAPVNTNEGVSAGGGGKRKPDTRANVMQKNITGIKGLSKQNIQSPQQNPLPSQANEALAYLQNNRNSQGDLTQSILQSQGMMGMNLLNSQSQTQNEQAFYEKTFGGNNAGQFLPSLSLWQGTIVPAVLLTGIDTGLPGSVVARVTRHVFSSLDGKFLLIPQGTLLFAEYNSSVGYAQKRVQIGWTAMIRPDGYFIQLANMPAVDPQGYSGITGKVNTHFWEFIKGLFLVSAISLVDTDVNQSAQGFTDPYSQGIIKDLHGTYQNISDKIIDKALNIEPSINIKSGVEINILINKTLFLPPVPVPEVTHKYVRRK